MSWSWSWSILSALFDRVLSSPATAGGTRLYAIGDIHGRLDLFRRLIKQLEADTAAAGKCSTRLILLGDMIDRGPDSRELLQLVRGMQRHNPGRIVALCGNHEEMLLASADGDSSAQRLWLRNGGDATLRSFGLTPTEFLLLAPADRAAALRRTIGEDMLTWLAALPLVYRSGDYFFCHAGVRPNVSLQKQRREDLLWIRREFLEDAQFHGAVIVHGHSETDEIEVKPNRINVDTAAYRSNKLTAVGLQGNLRWFVSTAQKFSYPPELEIPHVGCSP